MLYLGFTVTQNYCMRRNAFQYVEFLKKELFFETIMLPGVYSLEEMREDPDGMARIEALVKAGTCKYLTEEEVNEMAGIVAGVETTLPPAPEKAVAPAPSVTTPPQPERTETPKKSQNAKKNKPAEKPQEQTDVTQ